MSSISIYKLDGTNTLNTLKDYSFKDLSYKQDDKVEFLLRTLAIKEAIRQGYILENSREASIERLRIARIREHKRQEEYLSLKRENDKAYKALLSLEGNKPLDSKGLVRSRPCLEDNLEIYIRALIEYNR